MIDAWPFGALERGRYGVILADPPWQYESWSAAGEGRAPQRHYQCLTLADIASLPVADLAATDCALVLWAISPMLPHALRLMDAWGFEYKTMGAWAKRSRSGHKWQMGTGKILRSAAEYWLIGTRGAPSVRDHGVRNLIVAPVREHSRKPPEGHHICERLYDGPRLELFARARRRGWDVWGNQVDKFTEVA